MEKVFVISENTELYGFLKDTPKYDSYMDNIEFIHVTSATNVVERNSCVIIDKENYELDALRLFAKKMYVIICSTDGSLEIDIEDDNKVLVVGKPYSAEQLYAALKIMLNYKNIENEADKNKDMEVDVRLAAETDYLTGLPNRRGMYEYFTWGLKAETVHCMFMDIDNFKKVNDTYGHKIGDKLLIKVSQMVKGKIGDAFFVRLSGDEFAIILDGSLSKDNVIRIAENIMGAVDEVQLNVDVSSIISFSIGIIFDQSAKEDLDDILLRCDMAMYQAKQSGKGRYIVYNDIAKQVEYKMSVDREKSSALNNEQFKIYMQPRIDMVTSGVVGVEAGIYWEHPKDGLRRPNDFIELLEDDSFIVELEKQMFDELCRIMVSWKGTPLEKLRVYFRISKKHLYRKRFIEEMNLKMEKYGLKPKRLMLGLSEIDMHPNAIKTINELEKAGYSISCVKNIANKKQALLSVNDTMAHEWIIEGKDSGVLSDDYTSIVLARSLISLARELNIRTVFRGLREKNDSDYLTRWGCDEGVGEYFVKEMKPKEFFDYAVPNIVVKSNTYIYMLDGTLTDQNGQNEGKFTGEEVGFEYSEELKKQVIRFPGVPVLGLGNTLELPTRLMTSRNYTVSLSIRAEEFRLWNSVFYAEYTNGFATIMPYALDGIVMYRVKDTLFEEEWHDATGEILSEKQWYYLTVTYNSKKQEGRLYVNGKMSAIAANVHTVENPTKIAIGADLWQGCFNGQVGHVVIHDYVISEEEVKQEYETYMGEVLAGKGDGE